ncbi:MAG: hypothetical protein CVT80_01135 [Alphaproteobacteria bacterium HGW-Alphaproteobacteria-2]|nr:MAG: hypothetical protein CVT80_01135 [Alphaproteobacteria bacterium HGW-Alphaproteobacteria-2]
MQQISTGALVLRRGADIYNRLLRFFAGASMAALVAIITAQVVARYIVGSSLIWAEELARYILMWQAFLLVGLAYAQGELVAVEALPRLLGPRLRFALRVAVAVPILAFLWVMATNGYTYAWRFENQVIPALDFIAVSLSGQALGVPITWVYLSVSVGCTLLGAHVVVSLTMEALALRRAGRVGD